MNRFIENTLAPTNVPVELLDYSGSESTYIRYFYLPQNDFDTDDDEQYNVIHVQVDVFSPYDYTDLIKEVKQLMKIAGFKKSYENEQYEKDTKLYHKIYRFYIIKEAI